LIVEIADHGGARKVAAHPCASGGHMESDGSAERFQPDEERAIGIPFVIPRGNPRAPHGRYHGPTHIVAAGTFRAFRGATGEVKKVLKGGVPRTVGVRWPDTVYGNLGLRVWPRKFEGCGQEERATPAIRENSSLKQPNFKEE